MSEAAGADLLTYTVGRLASAENLEQVTGIVTEALRELVQCDGATFVLREDDSCFYVDENAIGPMWKGLKFPLTACISGWAMLHHEVAVIPDIYLDERVPHDAYRPTFVKSLVMVPIRTEDPLGSIGAYWSSHHEATPEEVRLQQVLANSAAIALENLELRGAIRRRSAERDRFEERTQELERAMHTLVHDLRSPLGVMLGYAEMLEDVVEHDADKALAFARSITASGQRMSAQIERMLSLYRVTSRPLQPQVVDISDLARACGQALASVEAGRVIHLQVDDDITACADPVLAELLVENLLANAIKYTGREGVATIRVEAAEPRSERDVGMSVLVVRDNGVGFDPELADELFRPMSRLHADADFPGTGLGLASVAQIADRHGGSVWAEGAVGEGASFFVALPSS